MKPLTPLKLFNMVAQYWFIWMGEGTFNLRYEIWEDGHPYEGEGLVWYDGFNATFWYILNIEWYRMNNRQFAKTEFAQYPFEQGLVRDFDSDHLSKF